MIINKSIYAIFAIVTTISLTLFSNDGVASYAQTNTTDSSNATSMASNATSMASNATSMASNATTTSSAQSSSSSNPAVTYIDAGISAIRSGDNDAGKKSLYEAEVALEDKPESVDAEKHVEAALKALKDGDTNGVIFHAEEAKKTLS